jgi:hypothetical protein
MAPPAINATTARHTQAKCPSETSSDREGVPVSLPRTDFQERSALAAGTVSAIVGIEKASSEVFINLG